MYVHEYGDDHHAGDDVHVRVDYDSAYGNVVL